MSAKSLLGAACILLIAHGVIELLATYSLLTGQAPSFVIEDIRGNWQQAILVGIITGGIRIVAAIGVF